MKMGMDGVRSVIRAALLLAACAFHSGCEPEVVYCIRSSDCPDRQQCVNGECLPEGTDAGVGVSPCDECIAGWVCHQGRCVPGCALAGCPPGLHCDPAMDRCVSMPVCAEVEDCTTSDDDDCDGVVGCADPDCAGEGCDDGVWCNGADRCMGGSCESVGPAPCEGFCDEAEDRCGECAMDGDCGSTETGSWTTCSYDGPCDATGTRTRMVTRHRCVRGMCQVDNAQESDADGCARNTQGASCGTNRRCFDGTCATRCGTRNNGSEHCGTLCAWCGGSCSAAEIESSGAIESCAYQRSGVNMWCYCTGI